MAYAAHHASEDTTTTLRGFAEADLHGPGGLEAPRAALGRLRDALADLRERDARTAGRWGFIFRHRFGKSQRDSCRMQEFLDGESIAMKSVRK